jgi:RNA polymerase sigma-70 factor, ECF subfamily
LVKGLANEIQHLEKTWTNEGTLTKTDSELVENARSGDLASFEQLILRYERSVRSIAWTFLHDTHACEDATQDAFVAAFRSLTRLRDAERFGPWLMQITRRTCQRAKKQIPIRANAEVTIDEIADARTELFDRERDVLGFLDQLPENERLVLTMRFFDGLSTQEIADSIGKPIGTITKQLSRAYERLRSISQKSEVRKK